MSRYARVALVAACLAVGAAVAAVLVPVAPAPPAPLPAVSASPAAAAAPSLPSPRRRSEPARARPHVPPTGASADSEATAIATSFDAIVAHEPSDASWHAEVSTRAREALDDLEESGVWLGDVDCGRTLCRVEVQLADEEAREAFDAVVSQIPTERGQAFVYLEDDRDLDIEVYLSRDGGELPILDL